MRTKIAIILIIFTLSVAIYSQDNVDPKDIVEHAELYFAPEICEISAEVTSKNSRTGGDNISTLNILRKRKKTLIEITSPKREKGKKIIFTKENAWMFFPRTKRVIPIDNRESNVGGFNYADLLRIDLDDDYDKKFIRKETVNDFETYKIELTAKSSKERGLQYKRVDYWISVKRKLPVKKVFYSLSNKIDKTIEYSELRRVGSGKNEMIIPVKIEVTDELTDTKAVMIWKKVKILDDISDYKFTKNYLEQ